MQEDKSEGGKLLNEFISELELNKVKIYSENDIKETKYIIDKFLPKI
jgi:hypothetical protein